MPTTVLSPQAGATPSPGRNESTSSIIDFSTKTRKSADAGDIEQAAEKLTVDGAKVAGLRKAGKVGGDSPLDLSGGGVRSTPVPGLKRSAGGRSDMGPNEKSTRRSAEASATSTHHAAAWAASLFKSQTEWNNGHPPAGAKGESSVKNLFNAAAQAAAGGSVSDATRALERMTELSRLSERTSATASATGGAGSAAAAVAAAAAGAGGGRQSAWQSHWLSKGADTAKDVLKCVWCKLSFDSLAALTSHMKESKHCGVNASLMHAAGNTTGSPASQSTNVASSAQPIPSPTSMTSPMGQPTSHRHSNHNHHHHNNNNNNSHANNNHNGSSGRGERGERERSDRDRERERERDRSERDSDSAFLKETVQLPRKLVRGQDVWLGKGAEQTRQILKCMWCGQSFRSLAEMTTHMQQTQHYTNIISQEQIISWKAADGDSKSGSGGGGGSGGGSGGGGSGGGNGSGTQNHVNAVLTCKVCDQAFASLKELSSHMVKNSHYKEHIMRSISESGGRRRQARDKRKKALPVRKLLELERAQQEARGRPGTEALASAAAASASAAARDAPTSALPRIPCEKCGDKIEPGLIVDHIRVCVGNTRTGSHTPHKSSQRSTPSPARSSRASVEPPVPLNGSRKTPTGEAKAGDAKSSARSPSSSGVSSSSVAATTALAALASEAPVLALAGSNEPSSVLNALEKLIEKSFDPASGKRGANAVGSNILRRLGIDESMDYTKPLMDPMTVNMLRMYGSYQRERSASEASSASERVNGNESTPSHHHQRDHGQRAGSGKSTPGSTRHDDAEDATAASTSSLLKIKRERADDSDAGEGDSRSASPAESRRSRGTGTGATSSRLLDEVHLKTERPDAASPCPSSISERSLRSATPASSSFEPKASSSPEDAAGGAGRRSQSRTPEMPTPATSQKQSHSLSALSSMFEGLTSPPPTSSAASTASTAVGGSSTTTATTSTTSWNPLAALQKLCDKTETSNSGSVRPNSLSGASGAAGGGGGTPSSVTTSGPGAILAFSWACNDAVMTDSIMKCAFCDTQFISKGAYRHHLSKMHFVKDAPSSNTSASGSGSTSSSGAGGSSGGAKPASSTSSASASASASAGGTVKGSSAGPSPQPPASSGGFEESPHSKFLKYTELAKQLSSKYVWKERILPPHDAIPPGASGPPFVFLSFWISSNQPPNQHPTIQPVNGRLVLKVLQPYMRVWCFLCATKCVTVSVCIPVYKTVCLRERGGGRRARALWRLVVASHARRFKAIRGQVREKRL